MPTARDAMYLALAEDAGVTAVVGEAIYPDQGEQDQEKPYLLIQSISDVRRKGMKGPVPMRRARFQLTGYCDTREEAQALQFALEELLDGKNGQTYGGLLVKTSLISEDEGAVDEDEAPDLGESSGPRVVRLDVIWWIKES